MRNAIGLAILAGAFSFAGGAEAAPPALSDHAAISRELAKPAEQAGRKARNKRYVKRRMIGPITPIGAPTSTATGSSTTPMAVRCSEQAAP